jgi:putative transposase
MKQTIIYKLKPNFEQEKHLHNLCSIATKLYNTDNWQRRTSWEETGKIPNAYTQDKTLKQNVWYKLLPSQTSQAVLFNLDENYKSWKSLRKTHKEANPPLFRKKEMLSPITFYQQFKLIGNNKIRISMSRKYSKEHNFKFIELEFDKWKDIKGLPKMCQIIFKNGNWFAHIISEVETPIADGKGKTKAIDLGIINMASCVNDDGKSKIYSGKQVLAIQHYFNSRIAKVQSKLTKQFPKRHHSKTLDNLQRKKTRQINLAIHKITKGVIDDCLKEGVKTLVIGDIKDIRKDKNFGKVGNQKLHSWGFSKLTNQMEYKATLSGIRFVRVGEEYTSQTCSLCGTISRKNRKHRGLYVCGCGRRINADINGATNILKKYLHFFPTENRSIGEVTSPLISRVSNVIPR